MSPPLDIPLNGRGIPLTGLEHRGLAVFRGDTCLTRGDGGRAFDGFRLLVSNGFPALQRRA
jgi:hypothetical protein